MVGEKVTLEEKVFIITFTVLVLTLIIGGLFCMINVALL
jgi:cell division protein FtsL